MSISKLKALIVVGCMLAAPASWAALASYSQDFEGLNQADGAALSNDGWVVGANVFDSTGTTFLYNYFTFPAPNGGAAFSGIDIGQGGPNQGNQQMVVYNDYNNADHAVGNRIQANVFQEQTISTADLGKTSIFSFDAKQGNIEGASTALAFIKVIDLVGGTFATLGEATFDTTALGANWVENISLSLNIDNAWDGQLLQFGFQNTASNYEGSGVFYDNVNLNVVPIPAAVWLFASGLGMLGWVRRKA